MIEPEDVIRARYCLTIIHAKINKEPELEDKLPTYFPNSPEIKQAFQKYSSELFYHGLEDKDTDISLETRYDIVMNSMNFVVKAKISIRGYSKKIHSTPYTVQIEEMRRVMEKAEDVVEAVRYITLLLKLPQIEEIHFDYDLKPNVSVRME